MFNNTIDRFDRRIDILKNKNSKIKKELTDLRKSVQYHSDNVDAVNKKLEYIDSRVEEFKLYEITEDFVRKTKKILADFKDRCRQNCLRFGEFLEETNETCEKSENIITDFVKENLRIEEDISKSTWHDVVTQKWWDKK